MLDFTLCCIESEVQKNLVLVWGKTGHGKTTLINYLFGTHYKSVRGKAFLIPTKGSYEKL
jgi:predicted GTPase